MTTDDYQSDHDVDWHPMTATDQDWSPTRPCPDCGGDGRMIDLETEQPCDACDGAGSLPRYAIRLSNVTAVDQPQGEPT